jgi:crotonobetainyl-CoA:carnitine CoA-transferase CaiB-like acyl-CoA transferase
MQILPGTRVIDITQFISGSRCTRILADMGADVVKVEPPQGDSLRMIFKLTPGAERCYFVCNRNKYGLALDWHTTEGREILVKLAAASDILVHNLVPGTLEKSGLGYDDIRKVNADDNLARREMFRKVAHAQYGNIDVTGFPFKFSERKSFFRAVCSICG